jgi:hypothetical protein
MYNRGHFKNSALFPELPPGVIASGGAERQSSGGGWIASLRSE